MPLARVIGSARRLLAAAALCAVFPLEGVQAQAVCRAPEPVCDRLGAVFAVSAFDPDASATRIGESLLVTNRHVVADRREVDIRLPGGGTVKGQVIPSGFAADLVLIRADSLGEGPVFELGGGSLEGDLHVLGFDIGRRAVRAYPPGRRITEVAGLPYARLHHSAYTQPGNSGGALVDADGRLVGIAASGGEGRFEAMPVAMIAALQKASGPKFAAQDRELGAASKQCLAATSGGGPVNLDAETLLATCLSSGNRQLFDLAAQILGRAGKFDLAIRASSEAVARDPNAINSRLTLVTTLHFAGRFEDEIPHLDYLMSTIPEEPSVARFAIQAGKWAGNDAVAQRGLDLLRRHNPAQLKAAERFLEADIPRPRPRTAPAQ